MSNRSKHPIYWPNVILWAVLVPCLYAGAVWWLL